MKRVNIINTIFLLTSLGCSFNSGISPTEYQKEISHAEYLVKSANLQGYSIALKYIPPEAVALKNLDPKNLDLKIFDEHLAMAQESLDFILHFENQNGEIWSSKMNRVNAYFDRLNYLNSGISEDLNLVVNGKDTIACGLAQLERTYGMSKGENLYLSFEKPKTRIKNMKILYNDRLFELGRINYTYTENDLSKIPKIDL